MLVVPIVHPEVNRCLAAIVMQNKREFDGEIAEFTEEDMEVMETFAKLAATSLKDSTLLTHTDQPKMSEAGRIFGMAATHTRSSKAGTKSGMETI